jgi:hypothetical protein
MGAAFSTTVSFMICPLLAGIVSQRHYRLRYSYLRIGKILAPLVAGYAAGSLVATGSLALDAALKCAIVVCSAGSLLLLGFLDERERQFARGVWVRIRGALKLGGAV